jgi:NitT/TauT family transport system ATP-binding protein
VQGIGRVGGDNLVIKDLYFSYSDELSIYDGLDIEIPAGEFVAILGPSGCGKTTLLNLLSGFFQPDDGSVLLRGNEIAPEDPHFGYVFQTATLFPWLTAVENVEFGLRMYNELTPKQRRDKAMTYLDMVGLSGFEDYLPARLSGGMQQRVSLARTLVLEPHLLLMDEPFAALDAITRETMNDELLKLWDKLGQTVVFITHDIDESIYLSDRIIVLNRPPYGIYRELHNELPRPRSGPETRTSELFWEYKKELIADIAAVTKGVESDLPDLAKTGEIEKQNDKQVAVELA